MCLWSTSLKNDNNRKCSKISIQGMNHFRSIMGMRRLDTIPGYSERQLLINKQGRLSNSEKERKDFFDQEFGKLVFDGKYHAVFLDEIKRSDGSLEANEYGEYLKSVRYGKFDEEKIDRLKQMTATVADTNDKEWTQRTTLASFHFYNEENQIFRLKNFVIYPVSFIWLKVPPLF